MVDVEYTVRLQYVFRVNPMPPGDVHVGDGVSFYVSQIAQQCQLHLP